MDAEAARNRWLNRIHPLAKLLVTFFYIGTVVSYDKYNLPGVLSMALYPMVVMILGEVSFVRCLERIWAVLLLVSFVGAANPLIERTAVLEIGDVTITAGMISMVTLMLKGCFAVLASYILMVTTTVEGICQALAGLHVPHVVVTVILLSYRYIIVLLKEGDRLVTAYRMRAPGQRGIHHKVWGPFLGQLLIRSMDRGQNVYESMLLRGYDRTPLFRAKSRWNKKSWCYLLVCVGAVAMLRLVPVSVLAGRWLIR